MKYFSAKDAYKTVIETGAEVRPEYFEVELLSILGKIEEAAKIGKVRIDINTYGVCLRQLEALGYAVYEYTDDNGEPDGSQISWDHVMLEDI